MQVFDFIKTLIPQNLKNYYHLLKATLAIFWFGYPARKLKVIGVTGTDGKTTTANLIYHILKNSGKKVALISTIGAYIGNKKIDTGFHVTTPDSWALQKLVQGISKRSINFLVLEATSHGLDQNRLWGTNIQTAVLTNITHEHLDYHKTLAKYVVAKSLIFKTASKAIISKDTKKLINNYLPPFTKAIYYDLNTLGPDIMKSIKERFKEKYNQLNCVAAVLVAKSLNIDQERILQSIKSFKNVEGRMEEIKNDKEFRVFIDFAHTPNALENVLKELRRIKGKGRLISVFGCAGERDKTKRPIMGSISAELADVSVFTAEDPRSEDVNEIIDQITRGIRKQVDSKHILFRIPDREKAISFAIKELAKKGDTIVICGKGHEKSMAYGNKEYPWSDFDAVKMALKSKIKSINHGR